MKKCVYENHQKKQRQMILTVAQDLFIQLGIDKVSTSMIAKECGLSRPTIYHYFPKKEDLYLSLIRDYTTLVYEKTIANCKAADTAYQRFEIFAYTLSNFLIENKKASALQLSVAQIFPQNELEKTDSKPNEIVAFLTEHFKDGSIRSNLDALPTALTFLYGLESTILTFFRLQHNIETRYHCTIPPLIEQYIQSQLAYLKA